MERIQEHWRVLQQNPQWKSLVLGVSLNVICKDIVCPKFCIAILTRNLDWIKVVNSCDTIYGTLEVSRKEPKSQ